MWAAVLLVVVLAVGLFVAWRQRGALHSALLWLAAAKEVATTTLRLSLPSRQRLRAGCVPIRIDPGGRLKLMLIRSRKHPEWFTFPAGGVESGETLRQAAARETLEEAGVRGQLGTRVARVDEPKAQTVMFSMHVLAEMEVWDESSRERCWFDLGVPGSHKAQEAAAAVRAALSPKALHQRVLDQVLAAAAELAREGELNEQAYRRPARPTAASAAAPSSSQHRRVARNK